MKIFIDENMPPQLAEGLSILEKPNNEGVEVFSIQKEFGRGIDDEDWIPKIGSSKGIVITQDFKMQRIASQYKLLRQYGLGIFYLIPPGGKGYTWKWWRKSSSIGRISRDCLKEIGSHLHLR